MTKLPTVIVAGAGPVGLLLTLRLAQHGIAVTLLEAETRLAQKPKAFAYMPILFPEFGKAGLWDDLVGAAAKMYNGGGICFRMARDADKRVFAQVPKVNNAPGPLLLPQYRLQELLLEHIGRYPHARVHRGHSVDAVDESSPDRISVTARTSHGYEKLFTASYLIGADGENSTVRQLAGIPFEGDVLPNTLVATDVRYSFEKWGWNGANFLVDEQYYGMISPIDNRGLWRCSFGIAAGSTPEDIEKAIPKYFNMMFPGHSEKYKLIRWASQETRQLCVPTFRKSRILLVGDAAHVTNPYIDMSLATGFLDATTLADSLSAILRHGHPEELLDRWSDARRNVFVNFVDPMSRATLQAVQNPDISTFHDRHPLLARTKRQSLQPPAPVSAGFGNVVGHVITA